MILVGNQRGGAGDLASHLMKDENEHITLHELRGFVSDDLDGAFKEVDAISRGTRCRQFLFSLSLNPPQDERVSTDAFERAIDQAETSLGLNGQPRAVVFHEKQGRRHAHAVWSRINVEEMKAIQLSHTRNKLMEVSRDLYREHGWRMPPGMTDKTKRDPKNFSLEEWQQARRNGKDTKAIKTAIQDAWMISNNRTSLEQALKERGYRLARGDRRGFLAVDHKGEPYSIPTYAGLKTKEVRARIGDTKALPSIDEARSAIAQDMLPAMERLRQEQETKAEQERRQQEEKRKAIVEHQRSQRAKQREMMQARQIEEARKRQDRFRKGMAGAWDRLNGTHKRIQDQNQQEAWQAARRDQAQRDALIFRHLEERRRLDTQRVRQQAQETKRLKELETDKQRYEDMAKQQTEARKQAFFEQRQRQAAEVRPQAPTRPRDGPDINL